MATTLIAYEEEQVKLGTLPSCHPRPNTKNTRELANTISERSAGLSVSQLHDNGYCGMVVIPEEYALVHHVL